MPNVVVSMDRKNPVACCHRCSVCGKHQERHVAEQTDVDADGMMVVVAAHRLCGVE
jgi:hypothetical protein